MSARWKHLVAFCAWTLLHGYFFIIHFTSWYMLIVFALAEFAALFSTVLGDRGKGGTVTETLGDLLGLAFLALLGYLFISRVLPEYQSLSFPAGVLGRLKNAAENGLSAIGAAIRLDVVGDMVLVGLIILGSVQKRPLLSIAGRYLTAAALTAFFLRGFPGWQAALCLYGIAGLIFMACDISAFQVLGASAKAGTRRFSLAGAFWLGMFLLDPNLLSSAGETVCVERLLIAGGLTPASLGLAAAVLWTAAVLLFLLERDHGKCWKFEGAYPFWNAGWILLTVLCAFRFYIGYWWLLAFAAVCAALYGLVKWSPARIEGAKEDDKKAALRVYGFFPALCCTAILFTVAGSRGFLPIALVFEAGLIPVVKYWPRARSGEAPWKQIGWRYSGLALWLGLLAASFLWVFRRRGASFLLLAVILAVCLAFVWFFSYDAGPFRHFGRAGQRAAVGALAVLCAVLCWQGGSAIRVETTENGIQSVEAVTRAGFGTPGQIEYYWMEDLPRLGGSLDGILREVQVSKGSIPKRDGRLRVKATDAWGTVTEQIVWVHVRP